MTGHRVTLTWDNQEAGEKILFNTFEKEGAALDDEVSLEENGWTVKTTNTSDRTCTWFNYPTAEFLGASDYEKLVFDGQRSAAVFMDMGGDDNDMHQDEWLISPVVQKGAYLQFSYYIDPRVLDAASSDPDFPDHYAVQVSTDGGKTWGDPIWDVCKDGKNEDAWQTVTLGLPADAESVRVAFRAYGDYVTDEYGDTVNMGLHAAWALDNVSIIEAAFVEFKTDFETGADETDMTFAADGWTVKQTVNDPEDPELDLTLSTWFKIPAVDDVDANPFLTYVINGTRSAMLKPDEGGLPQDEWLISPVYPGARQMTFSYATLSDLYGEAHPENPEDAYCSGYFEVYLSTDGGTTWSEQPVWKAADDEERQLDEETGLYSNTVQVTLSENPTDLMRVAFRVRGDAENGLATAVVVDDVTINTSKEAAVVAGYQIQLDGQDLARVEALSYVDDSRKTVGEHTYTVYAVTSGGNRSEAATVKVTLEEIVFAAPKNFTYMSEYDDATGKYNVYLKWDAPDVKYKPVFYSLYSDDMRAGTELKEEDGKRGVGRSGLTPGIYKYALEAVYQTPDSVSERVTLYVALGVRFGVWNLQAEQEGRDVVLTWEAPLKDENNYTPDTYTVYRSGEKLAEGLKEMSWRDAAVADGLYEYVVVAVYADGEESVRTAVMHQVGEGAPVALPYEQPFNTTFLPAGWRITNETDLAPDKYTWYFDDGSRLGIKGDGFDGNYAAIDCHRSGMYRINMALELPVFDLTKASNKADVTLSFNYSYAYGGISKVGVEWYYEGDEEWVMLGSFDKTNGYSPAESDPADFHIQSASMRIGDVIRATDLATMETLRLRFHYEGMMSNHWAIDNVVVSEKTANEKPAEDASVVVAASHGQMQVKAAQAIENVEVFARNGVKTLEVRGNGGMVMSLPVADRGPVLVRVTTARGVKVVKILL